MKTKIEKNCEISNLKKEVQKNYILKSSGQSKNLNFRNDKKNSLFKTNIISNKFSVQELNPIDPQKKIKKNIEITKKNDFSNKIEKINDEIILNSNLYKDLLEKNNSLIEEIENLKYFRNIEQKKNENLIEDLNEEKIQSAKLKEKNNVLLESLDQAKEELERKQEYISRTLFRQQQEMNDIKNLLTSFQSQAQNFPFFFLPFSRLSNPTRQINNINLDEMSYEQLINLQDQIGYVSRGFTKDEIKKIPKTVNNVLNEEDLCTICFSQINVGEKIRKLEPCKHFYHAKCIKTWLLKEKNCPVCKTQVLIPN